MFLSPPFNKLTTGYDVSEILVSKRLSEVVLKMRSSHGRNS